MEVIKMNIAEQAAKREEEELQRQSSIDRVSEILDSHHLTKIDRHLAMRDLIPSIRKNTLRRRM
jgi:hypothetical protein